MSVINVIIKRKSLPIWLLGTGITLVVIWPLLFPVESYVIRKSNLIDESAYDLNAKTGWYRLSDSSSVMITWGAENGLTLTDFENGRRTVLSPRDVQTFSEKNRRGEVLPDIRFTVEEHRVSGFISTGENGVGITAKKLRNKHYSQKEVTYLNGDTRLSAVIFLPFQEGPHSAVVFIHGSGRSDRDNLWYLYQADYLAKRGNIVLLPDKRGSGKSGGIWETASLHDFAADAVAAVRFLKNDEDIETGKIGLAGFSQGGKVAPIAASKSPDVDFVINVVGGTVTMAEGLKFEVRNNIINEGVQGFLATIMEPIFSYRVKRLKKIWWDKNSHINFADYWEKLVVPALIVYGDEDENVPVEKSAALIEEVNAKRHGDKILVKIFKGTGHGLFVQDTYDIRKDYLEFLTEWILNIN